MGSLVSYLIYLVKSGARMLIFCITFNFCISDVLFNRNVWLDGSYRSSYIQSHTSSIFFGMLGLVLYFGLISLLSPQQTKQSHIDCTKVPLQPESVHLQYKSCTRMLIFCITINYCIFNVLFNKNVWLGGSYRSSYI